MKTNIKMRVTPEQLEKICNTISKGWLYFKSANYMYIFNDGSIEVTYSKENWNKYNLQEIDADLFIRTNGTCEETFKEQQSYNNADLIIKGDKYLMIGKQIHKPYEVFILEQKLKKKNDILKKARIKRKNQREELHKLNLKLQKCISLEEHNQVVYDLKKDLLKNYEKLESIESENIEMRKLVNLNKSALDLAVITKELAMNEIERKNNEIEKLKAVIEYLESKAK